MGSVASVVIFGGSCPGKENVRCDVTVRDAGIQVQQQRRVLKYTTRGRRWHSSVNYEFELETWGTTVRRQMSCDGGRAVVVDRSSVDCLVITTVLRPARPAGPSILGRRPAIICRRTDDAWPPGRPTQRARSLIHIFGAWLSSSTTCKPDNSPSIDCGRRRWRPVLLPVTVGYQHDSHQTSTKWNFLWKYSKQAHFTLIFDLDLWHCLSVTGELYDHDSYTCKPTRSVGNGQMDTIDCITFP